MNAGQYNSFSFFSFLQSKIDSQNTKNKSHKIHASFGLPVLICSRPAVLWGEDYKSPGRD